MDAMVAECLWHPTWVNCDKFATNRRGSVRFSGVLSRQQRLQVGVSAHLRCQTASCRRRTISLEVSCCFQNSPASVKKSGVIQDALDDSLILKSMSQEVEPYLNGRCIYLVGMMGSGKTTVGRILSQVLGYSFHDCDSLVEQAVNGTPVADIFKLHGENFFRDKETEALRKVSLMRQLVVSTGGGAVIRPINWKYMHKGISVWLDVPLEALARRIAAVGTDSRPLLHEESGDAYTKRGEAYAYASARVSLENIAAKLGVKDVCNLTPTAIAIEALQQIEVFLKRL
ncbi:shikimate kinase 1, chloroplastic-like isoform X2 [Tripterygium wilfordii]|uniref:shikimate kinase 1, chloroplastic-like isoform X2 n=1 Tax=Tripterygium wilfordii TaxID=458696 RepID=UPI0018F7FEF2|nr:shikimate kinase 1, chloroplastic-like isoform X2 [Tripterygium wilfordii]